MLTRKKRCKYDVPICFIEGDLIGNTTYTDEDGNEIPIYDKNGKIVKRKRETFTVYYTEEEHKDNFMSISDNSYEVYPIPNPERREIHLVAGKSGVGKSFYSADYAKQYHKMYPERKIFFLSKKPEDEAFDVLPYVKRIIIDKTLFLDDNGEPLEQGVEMDVFRNSLVIFDDCSTFKKQILKDIQLLQDQIMELGRAYSINLIITNHRPSNRKETDTIHNEMTSLVLFPSKTLKRNLEYVYRKVFSFKPAFQKMLWNLSKDNGRHPRTRKAKRIWIKIDDNLVFTHSKGCFIPEE